MRKKRVLVLSEGFGAGHTQAAHALADGLKQLSDDVHTRVFEFGTFLHPTIAPWILSAYRKTVSSQPKLVGKVYRAQYNKSLNRLTQLALHKIFYTQAMNVIAHMRPDTIVCTHPIPNAVISRLKRLGLNIPLCTLITDYDAHGTWISPEVNKFLVSTQEVKNKLLERGIDTSRIEVTGIPVHPNFWMQNNKAEIRERFGLKEMPTVMVMGGGWGLLNNEDMLEYMTRWRDDVQLLFCMGSNAKAIEKLRDNPQFRHPNVRIFGFTREIDKLMDVSDVLITKPGGMTCTEGLAKGIPMLFYEPIPGQEEENCQYFVENGFGELLDSFGTIDRWFNLLRDQYGSIASRRDMLSMLNKRYDPQGCSQAILNMLQPS